MQFLSFYNEYIQLIILFMIVLSPSSIDLESQVWLADGEGSQAEENWVWIIPPRRISLVQGCAEDMKHEARLIGMAYDNAQPRKMIQVEAGVKT